MVESLFTFTRPQFEYQMETDGLEKTVRGVLDIVSEDLNLDTPLTLESLQDGTNPILDSLPRYENLKPEDRQLSQEEILSVFTNVRDFGRFDPNEDTTGKLGAVGYGAKRMVPETVGALAGFKGGIMAATPVASFIPPAGPVGLAARGSFIF